MKLSSIENFETRENMEYYKKLQTSRKDHLYEYTEKDYPKGFTMADKKVVDSRYATSLPRITKKAVLLFICYMILILIFSHIYKLNRAFITLISFTIVFILLSIPFFYLMKKNYYSMLMYIIVIIIFGTMGYGWGFFGVLVNLNPLKPKKPNVKNNIPLSNKAQLK